MNEGLVAPHIAGIVPYAPGKPIEELEREFGIFGDSVKLASNENPLGPSPKAIEAARAALTRAHIYPDGSAFSLRRAIAERLCVQDSEIALGAGSNELIDLMVRTFCQPGDEVLSSECTFPCYELSARAAGLSFRTVPLRDHAYYDLSALLEAAGPRTRMVFIANPNNPTGTHVGQTAFEAFVGRLPEKIILVMDEAYIEYVTALDFPDALRYRDRRERLVVLRTFSKARGLAGLRIGYGVAPAEMVSYVDRVRTPFNTSAVAQAAALAALDDEEHVARSRDVNETGKVMLSGELARLGVKVLPTQANFLLCELGRPAIEIFRELLPSGVIVRPMAGYGLPRHVRITIGTADQNRRLIDALRPLI